MIYLLAVIAGIVGAAAGWFVSGAITVWIAGLFGMSDFEGGRGMFAFLFVGPIGGLLSMIACAWLVLRLGAEHATRGRTLARLALVLGAIAAVVAAAIGVRLFTLDTYTNVAPPILEFELRAPAAMAATDHPSVRIELHTNKNVGEGQVAAQRPDTEDRTVISGTVALAFKTRARILVAFLPGEPARLFRLSLSRDPASTSTLGPWRRADHLDDPNDDQPHAAPADHPVEMRFRIRRFDE